MPWNGRRDDRETELPQHPGPKRPSDPTMVAKVVGPPRRPVAAPKRAAAGSRKADAAAARAKLPASVTMDAARVLHGEALPDEVPATGERSGVLYRLRIRDAAGNPVEGDAYHIRKHHVVGPGIVGFGSGDALPRIASVALDDEGGAYDFVGLHASSAPDGEDATFQYFSFELQGVTHAIAQSGYSLTRKKRGATVEVTRSPEEGEPIHGKVAKGLVGEKGNATFACKVAATGRARPRVTR